MEWFATTQPGTIRYLVGWNESTVINIEYDRLLGRVQRLVRLLERWTGHGCEETLAAATVNLSITLALFYCFIVC